MLRLPDAWVWDFWTARDGDTHHLFFLYASRALHDPELRHARAAIGHAVSTDLRVWERVADAVVHGAPGDFDATATWTGSVVQAPDGRWHMFYTGSTETPDGIVQQIGVATSVDLLHWDKSAANPLSRADPRWYELLAEPQGEPAWKDEAWRDPHVFADPDGNGWHMLVTARDRSCGVAADDRGVVGHAWSPDLRSWETGPPLSRPGAGFGQLEVMQAVQVDGRHVLLFSCFTSQLATSHRARGGTGGVWVAPAASPLGPYDFAAATRLTDEDFYVGKVVIDGTGQPVLLAFHNQSPDGAFLGEISDPMPLGMVDGTLTLLSGQPSADGLSTSQVTCGVEVVKGFCSSLP